MQKNRSSTVPPFPPEVLTTNPTFAGISAADAARIAVDLTKMNFDSGATILHQGKSIQALWVILSGECIVVRTADDGTETTLADMKPGDVFGEMSFIRSAPHSATVRAKSAVTVCSYTREDFLKLAESHPSAAFQICSNIATVLADRLRRMDSWICELVDRPEASAHRDEWQSFRSAVYSNWAL